jgi:hypothetical protein
MSKAASANIRQREMVLLNANLKIPPKLDMQQREVMDAIDDALGARARASASRAKVQISLLLFANL